MTRLRAIIIKEIWQLLRDPKARIVLVLPPLIQLFIFTFATTLDVRNVDIAVLDRSSGAHSAELIQRIDGSPNFRKIVFLRSSAELRRKIEHQDVIAALVIEDGFDEALTRGEPAADRTDARRAALQRLADRRRLCRPHRRRDGCRRGAADAAWAARRSPTGSTRRSISCGSRSPR